MDNEWVEVKMMASKNERDEDKGQRRMEKEGAEIWLR